MRTSLLAEDMVQSWQSVISQGPDNAENISLQWWQEDILTDKLKLNIFIELSDRLWKTRFFLVMDPGSKILLRLFWFSKRSSIVCVNNTLIFIILLSEGKIV